MIHTESELGVLGGRILKEIFEFHFLQATQMENNQIFVSRNFRG
jgi:hypothetical protein